MPAKIEPQAPARPLTREPSADLAKASTKLETSIPENLPPETKTPPKPAPKPKFEIPSILLEDDEPDLPTTGPGRKFALSPTVRDPGTRAAENRLPATFGSGKLSLTARDPRCLCVFWDLTEEQQQQYNIASEQRHLSVRVHLHNASGPTISETAVHGDSRHWFLQVPQAGMTYTAELGFYLPAHEWVCIASSAPASTPPDTFSEDRTVRFAEVTSGKSAEPQTLAMQAGGFTAQTFVRPAEESGESGWQMQSPWEFAQPHTESVGFPTDWTPGQERALEEIVSATMVRQEWFDSLQLVELLQKRQARRERIPGALPLAGPQFSLPAPSSAELIFAPPPAESVSSPFGGEKPRSRDFWFNVNAELIIYGATEPNARVTIGGRQIKLRPDGTFSYRFALPDGSFDLPAEATSVDDDTRRAALRFSRGTDYTGEVGAHPQDPNLKIPAAENVA